MKGFRPQETCCSRLYKETAGESIRRDVALANQDLFLVESPEEEKECKERDCGHKQSRKRPSKHQSNEEQNQIAIHAEYRERQICKQK